MLNMLAFLFFSPIDTMEVLAGVTLVIIYGLSHIFHVTAHRQLHTFLLHIDLWAFKISIFGAYEHITKMRNWKLKNENWIELNCNNDIWFLFGCTHIIYYSLLIDISMSNIRYIIFFFGPHNIYHIVLGHLLLSINSAVNEHEEWLPSGMKIVCCVTATPCLFV